MPDSLVPVLMLATVLSYCAFMAYLHYLRGKKDD